MKTPNYIITEKCVLYNGPMDEKVLEIGSFVCPIEYAYLPVHVKEDKRWKDVTLNTHVFCYTRYGIIPIEKNILRQK